ncbi:MAG: hypothetical protein A3I29_04150 [Candidatus Magasanikbacteria bacterium RIFCSPLOWO2_02_FULL_44_11]|uniref:Methyltransferase domain-containing protein n=2 Tax=Candidatus Magasanikiibacteriota TaxID=1752731 RepID=A0A1F6N9K4_9BACT|nr:MAG: hypothetical protein A3D53_02835 [Candidatus Magasanikbacteria bacterium RIFCSPHIGHO2_02_FULL_45_10]OGH80605.1 MAG: hypothetical protein A3I29_04150 [Candidatus Magasanikbacteria bacterium RIFCSPLOWO2_02_FULL_44_11]
MDSPIKAAIKKTFLYRWLLPVYRPLADRIKAKPLSDPLRWKLVQEYGEKNAYKCLIETGTYLGNMIDFNKNNFSTIFSIELDAQLAKNAQERFKEFPYIKILQGDSGVVLSQLLPTINEPVVFWLDAHYSAGITKRGDKETPIVEELAGIFSNLKQKFVILIDDARVFRGQNDYPTIKALKKYVLEKKPELHFEVADDVIRIY